MSRSSDDHGAADLLAVGDHIRHRAVMGKIDEYIRIHDAQLIKGLGDIIFPIDAHSAHHGIA